ncbi:MAG: SOS response-associated peptidase, partial [Gemmatimonadales bacterium]
FEGMCGRSTLHDAPVSVLGKFHLPPLLPGFKPRYNIVPSQDQWTIVLDDSAKPAARLLRWGLVPSWADNPSIGARLINARSDAVAAKPSFKESFRNRRCVILADGYYEWGGVGKARAPYFFHLDGHRDFALAGLWDRWQRGDEVLQTCIIITTQSSPFAARVHHRMPVVLAPDHAVEWVDAATKDSRLLDLMEPYSGGDLTTYEVSNIVNSPANDGVECIAPAPPKPLPIELSLFDL